MSIFNIFRQKPPLKKENPLWPSIISYWGPGGFIWSPVDYANLSKAGYQQVACVYGCVSLIAKAVGGVGWYVKSGDNEIDDHPLLTLLERPNEYASRARFIQEVVSYLLLSGNSYVLKVGGLTSQPRFLYTMRPDRMKVRAGLTPKKLIDHYEYWVSVSKPYIILPEDCLHLTEFHPTNDFYGLSRLEVAGKLIDISNLSMQWNANLLHNDMRTPGALKVEGQLTADQRKALQADLAKYQGADNAGRIPIFEGGTGGMDWLNMASSPKDVDWMKGEEYNLRRICSVFNVSSELMGDTTHRTYANAQSARSALYMEAVLPMLDLLKDEFNNWLAPLYPGNISLEYDRDSIEAIQEDRAAKYGYISAADFLTINEKREAVGYDKIGEEGDVIMVPIAKIPLKEAVAPPQPVPEALKPTAGKPPAAGEPQSEEPAPAKPEPEPAAAEPKKSMAAKSFWREPERKARLWTAFDRRVSSHEKALVPLVEKYLKQQADRVRARVDEGAAPHRLFNVAEETKAYVERFYPHYELAFRQAGQAGLHATKGKLWDPAEDTKAEGDDKFNVDPEMLKKLKAQIEKSATLFNETTWAEVGKGIEAAAVGNMTTEALAQSLWKALGDRAAWEARRIASTEMTRVDGWGNIEGYKQNDAITGKGWNCSMLPTSRDDHVEADGQEVGVDEDFDIGGYPMACPGDERGGPGEVINCRCSTYPIVE